jgi:hypothetical protein
MPTVKELQVEAKKKGCTGYSKLAKKELPMCLSTIQPLFTSK